MKWVYHALIYENKATNKIAQMMNEGTTPVWDGPVPTTFGGCVWHTGTVARMVKDPIYKGEFYARRYATIKTGEFNEAGREKYRLVERPRDEWTLIEVPPVVTSEEWALAQKRLRHNQTRSPRNAKRRKQLEVDQDELSGRIGRIESIEDRKAYASEILGLYRQVVEKAGEEPPLDLKKQILRMLVDTVWVNDQTMTARIDGVIPSTLDIMEISFVSPLTRKWR